jgi:hypothetical protein
MITMTGRIAHGIVPAVAVLGLLAGCGRDKAGAVPERQFASAEEAAAALVAATETFDVPSLTAILGADGEAIVSSEDKVLDRNNAFAFAQEARTRLQVEYDSARTTAVLSVGDGDWPLPIPIVQRDGRWYFDAAAGREEILRRRIGRNELTAIDICEGYVEAQRAYALDKHDGAQVNQYAQRIISTPGKKDGLSWRAKDGTWQGPIGDVIAGFIVEGYRDRYEPFHGYYFKVLKGQGPSAPLGRTDFMVEGAMIGGFALVAAPAEYMVTGVQTFIVSHDGIVYEKDLGDGSLDAFRRMELYDPDSTWTPVQGD